MITKITMNNVASFKKLTTLETDKKTNILYGLNGSGKTTISNFLFSKDEPNYSSCSVEVPPNELILVYNTSFIRDNFYDKPNQNGIFTLSKENKTAEENIKKAIEEITNLESKKKEKEENRDSHLKNIIKQKEKAAVDVWEIKTKYSGGDRVLEYCLDKLKSNKDVLLDYLCKINKPEALPKKTIEELKKEVMLLSDNSSGKYDSLQKIPISFNEVEQNKIFNKIIVGNENSIISGLIKQLNNADWVKSGIKYINTEALTDNKPIKCPFCQNNTITKKLSDDINNYFDEEYEKEITILKELLTTYSNALSTIKKEEYDKNPFVEEIKLEFDKLFDSIINDLNNNIRTIQDKITSPSQKYSLVDTSSILLKFNSLIDDLNCKIDTHNKKIDNKQESLNDIKTSFWQIMRYNYDKVIIDYNTIENESQKIVEATKTEIENIESGVKKCLQAIENEQRKTVNIDEAINNINTNLLQLGIDDFKILKHMDNFYKIIRNETDDNTFLTLSEGEKMIISFLYFLELCKGKSKISETINKKIIVIDDPISSLSHIYVFNISDLIKRIICNSTQFEQVFILTHSLYFFYEMTHIKTEKRKEEQKLFRIIKNSQGSTILEMKYEEIQNDYQSYWSIFNNPDYPPAIQANCMRNIIEYFFNFIEKKDLNNVFQNNKKLSDTRFQGFYRFINRESHSLGQNITDYKEFDYNLFKEALKLLFMNMVIMSITIKWQK